MRIDRNRIRYRRSGITAVVLLMALLPALTPAQTSVRVQTDLGALDLTLFDSLPSDPNETVANFMDYVNAGAYDGMLFHRSVEDANGTPFVLQTGGWYDDPSQGTFLTGGIQKIQTINPPLQNQFGRSNVRATLAMAKLNGDPDSATNEWFINLADNSANLDASNGGFTVFGEVTNGMDVVDDIFSLGLLANCASVYSAPLCGLFANMPVVDYQQQINLDTMVNVITIGVDADGDGAVDAHESVGAGAANVASSPEADDPAAEIEVATPSAANPLHSFQVLGRTFILSRPPIRECVLNGVDLANGLVAFDVSVAAGTGIDVDVTLPAGQAPDSYWMYGPQPGSTNDHWFPFTGITVNANVVTLSLVDGGAGDADMTQNGVIEVAPGGPASSVAAASLADSDCDGVNDSVESDPLNNAGDGNGDGTQDDVQTNVASLPDGNGDYLTLETVNPELELGGVHESNGNRLFVRASPVPLSNFNFPSGFLEFSVSNVIPGGSADVMLTLPVATPADRLFALGPDTGSLAEHWYEFTDDAATGTGMQQSMNTMTLHLVDGGRGDRDRRKNGIIYFAAAPAVQIPNSNAGGGGGGGGCSLATGAVTCRKAGAWWLLLVLGMRATIRRIMRRRPTLQGMRHRQSGGARVA